MIGCEWDNSLHLHNMEKSMYKKRIVPLSFTFIHIHSHFLLIYFLLVFSFAALCQSHFLTASPHTSKWHTHKIRWNNAKVIWPYSASVNFNRFAVFAWGRERGNKRKLKHKRETIENKTAELDVMIYMNFAELCVWIKIASNSWCTHRQTDTHRIQPITKNWNRENTAAALEELSEAKAR